MMIDGFGKEKVGERKKIGNGCPQREQVDLDQKDHVTNGNYDCYYCHLCSLCCSVDRCFQLRSRCP